MTDKAEVIEQIIGLTNTMEEGIQHIEQQIEELRFEESIMLLQDVVKAVATVQKATTPLLQNLPDSRVHPLTKDLMEGVGLFVEKYQAKEREEMKQVFSEKVVPVYREWKDELQKILQPLLKN